MINPVKKILFLKYYSEIIPLSYASCVKILIPYPVTGQYSRDIHGLVSDTEPEFLFPCRFRSLSSMNSCMTGMAENTKIL